MSIFQIFRIFKCQTNRFLRHNFSTDAIQTQQTQERIGRSKSNATSPRGQRRNHIFMRISWSGKFKVARGSLIKAEESIKKPSRFFLYFISTLVIASPIVGFVQCWAKPQNSEEFSLLLDAFSCETWEIWWEMPKTEQSRPLGTIEKKKKTRALIVTEL